MTDLLAKQYETEAVQDEIAQLWADHHAFDAEPDHPGDPYAIVIPPPNVTAALHLGHALNNTLQDVLTRWRRMAGDNAIWLPGTDHAGIATQTVVEKRVLADQGKRRTDFERDDFVKLIQEWKDEYEATITGQLKAMGCSCDWRRQAFTMDETRAAAVREAFFQLFKDGLIYRGKRLVNWDPATQTALADDEVEMQDVDGHFWYLRYPVIDEHGKETGEHVTVATTRPETMLGDTAVAVNPTDAPRAKFIGQHVKLPIVGRVIPVIGDDYVVKPDPESSDDKAKFASGFLKVTPAHDPNDYDIGLRHDLPMINVMAPDGSISDQHGWPPEDFINGGEDLQNMLGLDRYEAREAIVTWFRTNGLLEEVRPYKHTVGHSYRSHVPVEPYLSDQWYVKVTDDRLAGAALRALTPEQRTQDTDCVWTDTHPFESDNKTSESALEFTPARYAKTFQTWHENIRDWCISRQLWWGHRIPVWTRHYESVDQFQGVGMKTEIDAWQDELSDRLWSLEDNEELATFFVQDDDPDRSFIKHLSEIQGGFTAYVCLPNDINSNPDVYKHSILDLMLKLGFAQDPDVLDTWFSSALWPLSTLGWPEESAELAKWNPTNVLSTAREIITLWVSRMVMFNCYFKKQLPFTEVFIHAMIQDGDGRKMSKSLGNGVDPLDIIHTHGADAMRFTLVQMTTQTQDVRMPVEPDEATGRNTSPKFDIGRNFCTKMWNAARFALGNLAEGPIGSPAAEDLALADRWVLSRLAQTITTANKALGEFQFNVYAQAMYDFFWRDLCDWYLEAIKPIVREDTPQGATARAVLAACLDAALRLLHPITPFVTEKLFQQLNAQVPNRAVPGLNIPSADLCIKAAWPAADESTRDETVEFMFERIQELVGMIRQVRNDENVPPRETVDVSAKFYEDIVAQAQPHVPLIEHLANIKMLEMGTDVQRPENSAVVVRPLAEVYLHKQFDPAAEFERLTKRQAELQKSRGALSGRLNNKGYTDKAPAHLVEETREQLAQVERELETVAAGLARLQ